MPLTFSDLTVNSYNCLLLLAILTVIKHLCIFLLLQGWVVEEVAVVEVRYLSCDRYGGQERVHFEPPCALMRGCLLFLNAHAPSCSYICVPCLALHLRNLITAHAYHMGHPFIHVLPMNCYALWFLKWACMAVLSTLCAMQIFFLHPHAP